jgi:hypothetical protein
MKKGHLLAPHLHYKVLISLRLDFQRHFLITCSTQSDAVGTYNIITCSTQPDAIGTYNIITCSTQPDAVGTYNIITCSTQPE